MNQEWFGLCSGPLSLTGGQFSERPGAVADSGARRRGFRDEREKRSGAKTNTIPG